MKGTHAEALASAAEAPRADRPSRGAPLAPRVGRSALAALGGLLIALGGAPLELSFPAFLAPAALMLALEPRPGRPVSLRQAAWLGLLTGFTANLISMYWVVGLLEGFGGFPTAAAVGTGALLWAGQSIAYVAAATLAAALVRRRAPAWVALPATLTVAASLAPALFPWRYGLSQLPFLPYAQVAEIGGLPLLDWLVATVGCGALEAARRSSGASRRSAATPALAAALAFGLPLAYGAARVPAVRAERRAAPVLRVGVVQPNVGIFDKHDERQHVEQLAALRQTTRELEARGAQLTVWPESSYPFPVHRELRRDRGGRLGLRAEGVQGPLLVGVLSTDGPLGTAVARDADGRFAGTFRYGAGRRFNSALAVERDGRVSGIADKVRLLAFGEYTPLWELVPWLQRFPRGLSPGRGSQAVAVAGARVGVLNCYEDLLPDHVRWQAGVAAPDFWANLTNDAWFGDTSAPHLHHMNARLRAIETRRDLVRAVNTGVSGHTAATGEDVVRTAAFVPASFVTPVRLLRGTTPWVRFGDWVTPLLAAALAAFVLSRRRR